MNHPIQTLRVARDQRHIIYEDGAPFLYLADTAWELFHKLDREEAFSYLQDRADKGFTVVQAVALSEKDGLRRSNAYGRSPMKIDSATGAYDPALIDEDGEYSYWAHMDAVIERAGEMGLYIALLPAWGDKFPGTRGEGPHFFNPENAFAYGEWLGRRYAKHQNIIWVMGGGCAFTTRRQLETLDAMARGLKKGDDGSHLMTMLPASGQRSSDCAHDEAWLDFNMVASGQSCGRYNYDMIRRDVQRLPHKPVLDGAPNYEGYPADGDISKGYMDDADARRSAWWAILSGACGHAYGHHPVANCTVLPDKDTRRGFYAAGWRDALQAPGSGQMTHLRALMDRFDWSGSVPAAGIVAGNMEGVNFVPVRRGMNWLIAYSAQGLSFDLNLAGEWDGSKGQWFNPRTGETGDEFQVQAGKIVSFVPPCAGRGSDWVLILRRG